MAGPGRRLRGTTARFLGDAFQTGFDPFEGQTGAGLSPEILDILSSFFAPGGGLETSLTTAGSINAEDALGRAERLLRPGEERSIERFRRGNRESRAVGGNLLSTTGIEAEERGVGDIISNTDTTLAGLLPALTSLQLQGGRDVVQSLLGGLTAALQERGVRQDLLDREFAEFLRTAPASAGGRILDLVMQANAVQRSRSQQRPRGPTGFQDFTSFLSAISGFIPAGGGG